MTEIYTVPLPEIGEGVIEGEVIEWLKQEGDPIAQDELVVVVMTDKATVELPAPYPGVVQKHYFKPGEIAIRDKPLYDIALAEGVTVKCKKTSKKKEQSLQPAGVTAAATSPSSVRLATVSTAPSGFSSHTTNGEKALATPAVRGLAKKLGIDLGTIKGTGPGGRVLPEDLKVGSPTTSSGRAGPTIRSSTPVLHLEGDTTTPLTGFRRLTAEKMVESQYIIPHFAYFDSVEATRLCQLRANLKKLGAQRGIQVTFMPLFIRALSLALTRYPVVNSSINLDTNSIITHSQQNIGIAMSGPNGLVVPVMKQVEKMSLEEIIVTFDTLKKKAMEAKITSCDMKHSTITISNFGALGGGGVFATPIINYPEAAILGVARIKKAPVVRGEEVVVRDLLNLSWSFDHRIVDGDMAAEISHAFTSLIANPSQML